MVGNSETAKPSIVDKSPLRPLREKRWSTAGASPARELVRSTR